MVVLEFGGVFLWFVSVDQAAGDEGDATPTCAVDLLLWLAGGECLSDSPSLKGRNVSSD